MTRRQLRSYRDICLALPPSPASLGAESLLLPCFWHLYPRKTDGFASPWIHTQSHAHTHPHTQTQICFQPQTLCMHTRRLIHICFSEKKMMSEKEEKKRAVSETMRHNGRMIGSGSANSSDISLLTKVYIQCHKTYRALGFIFIFKNNFTVNDTLTAQ